jgi:putative hemolysin
MIHNFVLILIFALLVVLAGLFAGTETGLYRLSRLRLRLGVEKKHLKYILLGRCLHDGPGLLLSLLIGTNLSHYLATSIVTWVLLTVVSTEHMAEIITTALTAPFLFVFAELIPKNIFFYRSDSLMPYMAPVLYIFHKFLSLCGVVPVLKFIATFFARLAGSAYASKTAISSAQRHTVQAFLYETQEEGILSSVQTDIVNRLVKVSSVRLKSVMIPLDKVKTIDINSDYLAVLNVLDKSPFTRLPVTEEQPGNVIGFINIYETLSSSKQFSDLRDFISPINTLDMNTTVFDAMSYMQKQNQKILLVTRASPAERRKPLGIVTMKDLVEELLGELAEW